MEKRPCVFDILNQGMDLRNDIKERLENIEKTLQFFSQNADHWSQRQNAQMALDDAHAIQDMLG